MNETIDLMMRHRSIRKFTKEQVPPELLRTIVQAGQMASTSSNVQAYSIIHVTDSEKRRQLAALAGNQEHVTESPVFLVWCADLYRLKQACDFKDEPAYIGTTENMVVSLVDVALAAQNAAVAAESLGLGIVYIGGIRNKIAEAAELLGLPELVTPVFGMCIGYPDQNTLIRPRLPLEAVFHENSYSSERYEEQLNRYDIMTEQYMLNRTGGKRSITWRQAMRDKLSKPARLHMKSFLASKRFWEDEK
ncbi:oxygen-insensitive NADPH nitroreductase [Paenibacillus thalictri]|uniref:Oxygen-insensitive NADPH nitroreductase n=1 Tax=Paenibacillus thalictri TaxID=2527873 RepID=A0A4Q9DZD4_9BACL|nr:oxygen-insensitive NADPH nitroreductase [Paenibacillus thalictri]TBL81213.1 oxygen-insensitive NADPH nitroreductase [Paenibacillus thalictri]